MPKINDAGEIERGLAEPFDPKSVEFRVQSKAGSNGQALVVAYIDARDVAARLDEVVGVDGWAFDWDPIVVSATVVLAAKGKLTIAGVTKCDVGDAGDTEQTKASVSDALKRTAVLFGVGRYLYSLPQMWAEVEEKGRSVVVTKAAQQRLRFQLPKPAANGRADVTSPVSDYLPDDAQFDHAPSGDEAWNRMPSATQPHAAQTTMPVGSSAPVPHTSFKGKPCRDCGVLVEWVDNPAKLGKRMPIEAEGQRHDCPHWQRTILWQALRTTQSGDTTRRREPRLTSYSPTLPPRKTG